MLYTIRVALTVALGGFLMGFDASVISGVVTFIEPEFSLSKIELGWSVASLTLTATLAMMVSGPLSDRLGRRPVLKIAAVLFAISAVASAVAPSFIFLVAARMLGGLGVGAALIIAPMYIAEIAPAAVRGRMVSFNQLNIVVGISAAFFTNYLILRLGRSDLAWAEALHLGEWNWRWMLGVEALPAIFYFVALFAVPESPRWLVMNGRDEDARRVLEKVADREQAEADIGAVKASLQAEQSTDRAALGELFRPAMRLVLVIGIAVAILQQVTGINSVFFYAPMIFEQSGIGTDAAFMQAVLVGLVNLVFTVLAILFVDRVGRRPLLGFGLTGIALCMLLLSYGFAAEEMNPQLILVGILGFVASFAISLGPVMWVLFSELFPNRVRGLAISFVGLINSAVSFLVQLVFPWELENLGNSLTFLIYGLFAIVGLIIVMRILPETKGKSLEELESELVRQ
ncbi:MAG: sugar porter family MFS transporter [Deltaproteobacteria bacterium]|nr:sugar porter family MFS transporter [Deltaproteobacteria bacterium]NND27564.1 sugar porter family MFS transporter [Myxococcales bacterium]MBT8464106.1 sugar porter family MFS transporter [Deltaproteobacteria bacterium]MBT8481482.1 sugar porter family MFS transporter [Deltaproteobacteria bacterium]NNK08586.1 sugar porter family MFS transporter [Myxococcales bacterium]